MQASRGAKTMRCRCTKPFSTQLHGVAAACFRKKKTQETEAGRLYVSRLCCACTVRGLSLSAFSVERKIEHACMIDALAATHDKLK